MVSIAVIPILLVIAVIPPVLAPDSDPVQFLQSIIPSVQVACAGDFLCLFTPDEVGIEVLIGECQDTGCSEAGGRCVSIQEVTARNGIGFCMCEFPAVGGWFLEVDKPSILIAGAQYTAAWMLPVIISAIGIGIVIARKF